MSSACGGTSFPDGKGSDRRVLGASASDDRAIVEGPHRRLLPREQDNRTGKYRIEDVVQHRWRPFRLIDISLAGAGLELMETAPEVLKGKTITLKFENAADVRLLTGEICQIRERVDGRVTVGLRFLELTEATLKHLAWLKESSIRW